MALITRPVTRLPEHISTCTVGAVYEDRNDCSIQVALVVDDGLSWQEIMAFAREKANDYLRSFPRFQQRVLDEVTLMADTPEETEEGPANLSGLAEGLTKLHIFLFTLKPR